MQPQQPMRDAVEGADPQRLGRVTQQALDAAAHFAGRLVGESHRQNAVRRDILHLAQPRQPVDEHARLAAAGTGQHQYRAYGSGDGGTLRVVQRRKDGRQIHGMRILYHARGIKAWAAGRH
jgi:hypothetical protein